MIRSARVALTLAMLASCSDDEASVLVDLKTDLLAGHEFFAVRTEIAPQPFGEDVEPEDSRDVIVDGSRDFLRGARIAEFDGIEPGVRHLRVSLLDDRGAAILVRLVTLRLEGQHGVTVVMTRNCRDIVCPEPAGDPAYTTCAGGQCVSPECTPENPAGCGGLDGCTADSDCSATAACARGLCVEGQCFAVGDSELCAPTEVCAPDVGCVLRPDVDAGPPCPPSETACADGEDDDCDGLLDCADPDCVGQACDDGSVCTESDVCTEGRVCGGTAVDCDDGNVCTTDSCDPASGCANENNTASCDDGFWCNGPDTCMDGSCSQHGPAPCATFCNETAMRCDACATDADCGAVTYGTWGACDYSGTCDESATQSRPVMTPRCTSGMCEVVTTSESRACTRDTDGTSCGSTTYGSWGSCNYSGTCDESATQSRTVTMRRCSAGSCASQNSNESRACTRSRPNGYNCGATQWHMCCSGTCRDTRNNNNYCGTCQVSCASEGLTCASTGTGGYACRGCSTNAQCQRLLNSAATCYISGSAFCNCQCAGGSTCTGAGCGGNFRCFEVSGHNYCGP